MRHLPVFLLALALAVAASGDESADRVRAAAARLASDDPAERDRGETALAEAAREAPEAVRALLDSGDAEFNARVERVCRRAGILKSVEDVKRREEILAELGRADLPLPERRDLVRELLDLGPETVEIVARELAEGSYAAVPEEAEPAIARPRAPGITVRVRNTGDLGCWMNPHRNHVMLLTQPLGLRPGNLVGSGGGIGAVLALSAARGESPEDAAIRHLAGLVRLAPSAERDWATSSALPARAVRVQVQGTLIGYAGSLEAAFHGITLKLPEGAPHSPGARPRVVLGESAATGFEGRIVRDGDDWALEIRATADHPAATENRHFDNWWWATEDAEGRLLDAGALDSEPADRAAWHAGDVRRVRLKVGVPAEARRLWAGYDHDFKSAQVVPAPADLPPEGK